MIAILSETYTVTADPENLVSRVVKIKSCQGFPDLL